VTLVLLYALHSLALLCLPRANPELFAQVTERVPLSWQRLAGSLSLVSMLGMVVCQLVPDARVIGATNLGERWRHQAFTSLELLLAWTAIGLVVHALRPSRGSGARS